MALLFGLSREHLALLVFELYIPGLRRYEFSWDLFLWLKMNFLRVTNIPACRCCLFIFTAAEYSIVAILLTEMWVVCSFSFNLCEDRTTMENRILLV